MNLLLAEAANSAPLPAPVAVFSLVFFVSFAFGFSYLIGTPSILFRCSKFNRALGRKMTVGLELDEFTDEELLADAKVRSRYIRSIIPIGVVCVIVFANLIEPYNWLFVIIIGPLLAVSYYKVIDSIMALQEPDDETSDENTD